MPERLSRSLLFAAGALEGLLVARLLLLLLAARPDNPTVAALLSLTEPIVAPLSFVDAGQPRFGAVLELSTLILVALVPFVVTTGRLLYRRLAAR